MISVKKLLELKGSRHVCTLTPEHMVIDALALMGVENIGAIVIMQGDRLVGTVCERDYVRKGIVQGRKAKSTPLAEIMRTDVPSVTLDMDIEDCMQLFTDKRTRHLPVVDGDKLVGLLSIGDIVSAMLQDQNNHIKFLEQYISGR